MKTLPDPPDGYYDKFKTKPVTVKPFDPASRQIAAAYVQKLRLLLRQWSMEIALRGSTAWGIAGKGDIEIAVFPTADDWLNVIEALTTHYGPPGSLEPNYARFNDIADGFDIEIVLLRGYEAVLDRRLHAYLSEHPELLVEYEQVRSRRFRPSDRNRRDRRRRR